MIILHLFHIVNKKYDSESGHHYLEKPAYGLVFCFLGVGQTSGRGNALFMTVNLLILT